jgi:outer membrane immunogenic protein
MFRFALIAATAAAVAAPAMAQDAERFNGPFIGGQLGWQQDRQTLTVGTLEAKNNASGLSYGGQLGYDFRLGGSTVLGLEAFMTGRTGQTEFDDFDLRQGRTFGATARLGYLLDESGLLYARGGWANARFTADDGVDRVSENRDGFTVGAGYERYLSDNVSARIEYNYSDFGKDDLSAIAGPGAELAYRRHAITAGVNFRF